MIASCLYASTLAVCAAGAGDHELVADDADGLALDPDLRPSWGLGAAVTDVATQTRRGRVVGLDGWTSGTPDLHCSALWIEWADQDEPEWLDDLSSLLNRCGHRHSPGRRCACWPIPAWEAVYDRRRAERHAGQR